MAPPVKVVTSVSESLSAPPPAPPPLLTFLEAIFEMSSQPPSASRTSKAAVVATPTFCELTIDRSEFAQYKSCYLALLQGLNVGETEIAEDKLTVAVPPALLGAMTGSLSVVLRLS